MTDPVRLTAARALIEWRDYGGPVEAVVEAFIDLMRPSELGDERLFERIARLIENAPDWSCVVPTRDVVDLLSAARGWRIT